MTFEEFHDFALSLPGATEMVQWGSDLLFKVGDKVFIFSGFNPPYSIGVKVSDAEFEELIEKEGCKIAPYVGRYKWVSIDRLDRFSDMELKRLIRQSYSIVRSKLPKKVATGLPPFDEALS